MSNQSVTDLFDALADPSRREILELLARDPRPVQDLARCFPFSRPAVSKHLRILRRAGLVRETRRGRQRVYALERAALAPAADWLAQVLLRRRRPAPARRPEGPPAPSPRPTAPPRPQADSWAPWSR
jgi:DNA-binding transcriptional ArsR family regulator